MVIYKKHQKELELYLNSDLKYTPPNLTLYQVGFEFEHLCPLCDEPHEDTEYQDFPSGVLVNLCGTCAYEISIRKLFIGNRDISGRTFERLNNFIATGKAPYDFPEYTCFSPDSCLFCSGHTPPSDRGIIEIPVGAKCFGMDKESLIRSNYNYYRASVCDRCYDFIKQFFMEHKYQDTCYNCEIPYPVAKHVYKRRTKKGTLGWHACSNCWLHGGFTPNSLRLRPIRCDRCKEIKIADYSLASEKFFAGYIDKEVLCKKCLKKHTHLKTLIHTKYHLDPNIVDLSNLAVGQGKIKFSHFVGDDIHILVLRYSKEHWIYQILRCEIRDTNKGELIDYTANTTSDIKEAIFEEIYRDMKKRTLVDATTVAMDKAFKILEERKQIKLTF